MDPNSNQQANDNQGPMAMPTQGPKSRYSNFFLIMLILASIGAFFSFIALFPSIFSGVVQIGEGQITRAVITLLSIPITIAGLVALALLFMKKKSGFVLQLVVIALGLALSIASTVVTKASFVKDFKEALTKSSGEDAMTAQEQQFAANLENLMNKNGENLFLAFGIVFSIISSSISFLIWVLAWRSQLKHDSARF